MTANYRLAMCGNMHMVECRPSERAEWHPLVEWAGVGPRIKLWPFKLEAMTHVCVLTNDLAYWVRDVGVGRILIEQDDFPGMDGDSLLAQAQKAVAAMKEATA